MTTVSIILVNYNGSQVVIDCLDSLQNTLQTIAHEVIVVDNASTDGSADLIETLFPTVHLVRQSQNRGFGAGNNRGASLAKGEFLLLLNTDTLLTFDILPYLVDLMRQDLTIGIIGPRLLNPDGGLQRSTAPEISIWGECQALKQQLDDRSRHQISQKFAKMQDVDIVVGAALFIRRGLFEVLAGFDETFFMYFEESDLCRRAQTKGWKVVYAPSVSLIHLGGYSVSKTSDKLRLDYRRSQLYYYQKHRPVWEQVTLRIYLAMKLVCSFLYSFKSANLEILRLILDFKHYPLKRSKMSGDDSF
jgi:GT2 family glycosyltransferase